MSLGTDRVRAKFNPGAHSLVDEVKQKTAELIDICETEAEAERKAERPQGYEALRLWIKAQEAYEEAAMWAVKAATWEK